jgi:hypothetical protein
VSGDAKPLRPSNPLDEFTDRLSRTIFVCTIAAIDLPSTDTRTSIFVFALTTGDGDELR